MKAASWNLHHLALKIIRCLMFYFVIAPILSDDICRDQHILTRSFNMENDNNAAQPFNMQQGKRTVDNFELCLIYQQQIVALLYHLVNVSENSSGLISFPFI